MKPIRVGVIGTGWGQLQIEAFRRVRSIQVVAVCDVDPERGESIAKQYRIDQVYSDYRKLSASDVEWIGIATPPEMHAEIVRAAIEAGKHIFLEKPLALDIATSKDLVRAADEKGIVHSVDLQVRFLPAHQYVKELIDEGYLGRLLHTTVSMVLEHPWGEHGNWALDDARGGGVLFELGAYFVDLLRWWFGDVTQVFGRRKTLFPSVRVPGAKEKGNGSSLRQAVTTDDAFWCILDFNSGGEAIIDFVTGARHDAGWTIGIYGEVGSFLIKSGQLWARREGEREMELLPIPKRLEFPENPKDPLMWAMTQIIDRTAAKIRKVPNALAIPDFGDELALEEIVHAIRRSSIEQRWAKLGESA